jgi:hypothetical protein
MPHGESADAQWYDDTLSFDVVTVSRRAAALRNSTAFDHAQRWFYNGSI